jgi:hypothetical protein
MEPIRILLSMSPAYRLSYSGGYLQIDTVEEMEGIARAITFG